MQRTFQFLTVAFLECFFRALPGSSETLSAFFICKVFRRIFLAHIQMFDGLVVLLEHRVNSHFTHTFVHFSNLFNWNMLKIFTHLKNVLIMSRIAATL